MKKLFCIVLALLLCLMLSVSAVAIENSKVTEDLTSFVVVVANKVRDVLEAIELQKDDFGLGDIDFSTLALGNEIPSYELTSSGLVHIDNVHYFPVLSGEEWVATAVVSYSEYGDMNVEVSAKYAADYMKLSRETDAYTAGKTNSVAIVFDSTDAYLYSAHGCVLIESFQKIPGRKTLAACTERISPTTVEVACQRPIELQLSSLAQERYSGNGQVAKDSENFASLIITAITQPTNYTCWAASTAMILNYRGTAVSVANVVSEANVNMYTYRSAAHCANLIRDEYGYPCGTWGTSSGYYYSLTLNNLITELYSFSSPLFAGFGSGSVGHAVVIKGYTNLSATPTMSYIDPADGFIKASTIPNNGAVTITYGGNSHELAAAFAVYEKYDY